MCLSAVVLKKGHQSCVESSDSGYCGEVFKEKRQDIEASVPPSSRRPRPKDDDLPQGSGSGDSCEDATDTDRNDPSKYDLEVRSGL